MRSGDIVEYSPLHFYVYELLDDSDVVFYVGKTNNPGGRLAQHLINPSNKLVLAKLQSLSRIRMRITHGPVVEKQARLLELEEISRPGRTLLNQEHQPSLQGRGGKHWNGNERHPSVERFLRTASKC